MSFPAPEEGTAGRAAALLSEYGLAAPDGRSEVLFADASEALAARYAAVLKTLFPQGLPPVVGRIR